MAKFARETLSHMLHVDSVSGDFPNRVMTITLLGAPGESRRAPDGTPGELSWRDPHWATQTRHQTTMAEQELIGTLNSVK